MAFAVPARVRLDDCAPLIAAGRAAVLAGETAIVLRAATDFDSALVTCLIEWRRCAAARGAALALVDAPAALRNLAGLYGVESLLFA
jgi:phospholipid transport system transporter-binding protein